MSDTGFLMGTVVLENVLMFLLGCVAVVAAAYLIYKLVKALLLRRASRSVARWTARFAGYLVLLAGIYLADRLFLGFDITATLASVGIISIALAFASQQIISSLLAGFLITLNRTIALDDWVEVGGQPETGISQVKDITFTRTILRDRDGRVYMVPNATLLSSKVINYAKAGFIEIPLTLIIPHRIPFPVAKKTILSVLEAHREVLPNGGSAEAEGQSGIRSSFFFRGYTWLKADTDQLVPRVMFTGITNQGNTLSVRFWIRDIVRREDITSEILAEISARLGLEHEP